MKKSKYFYFLITIFALFKSNLSSAQHKYNVQIFSLIKPKLTDCGVISIDEDYNELVNIYMHEDIFKNTADEDENIDMISKNSKKKISSKINKQKIANLSACISDDEIEDNYTAFTTRLTSKMTRSIFETNFYLDEKRGILYTKNKIDREKICAHAQKLTRADKSSNENKLFTVVNNKYTSSKSLVDTEDTINCDCKSETCELRFKFVAFKDENTKLAKLSKSFKYLYLTVKINDLNDQIPKFKEKFIYLNISENIGEPVSFSHPSSHKTNDCKQIRSSLMNNDFADLIPIERAFDLDANGVNSQMSFVLYMFKNTSAYFIPLIELEKSETKRDFMIKNAMNTQIAKCGDMFELVDSGEMLFLKVNTHLDREKQDVYNFIIIASDASNLEDYGKIRNRNFVLIKLVINDLNDNQPVFTESKYVFEIRETVQFDEFYSSFNNDFEYYANLFEQTCLLLKNRIKVNALDNDYGFNSLIKYRVVQQVYRKNSHTSYSTHPFNSFNIKNRHMNTYQQHDQHDTASLYTKPSTDTIHDDSIFYIDETEGTVSLVACTMPMYAKNLTQSKFLELTSLLDYETYSKHILLVEARDSNPYNSLQAVVTLEINLIDVNDNPPMLTGIFSEKCSTTIRPKQQSESNENSLDIKPPHVSIQYFNVGFDEFHVERNLNNQNVSFSTVIIVEDYSEYNGVGDCVGQFLINDLDTDRQNRHIDVAILNSSNLFSITKLKDENDFQTSQKRRRHQSDQMNTNEKFELFLKFHPDAEQKRFYDLTLLLTDNGNPFSFKSYAQIKILIKDENDNEPKFAKKNYNLSINEWNNMLSSNLENTIKWENECIGRIEAYDSDVTEANSIIYYRLNEIETIKGHRQRELYNSNYLNTHFNYVDLDRNFYINKTTGDICVRNKKMIDREIRKKYEFLITASNDADDTTSEIQLESSTILQINILDLNDNAPEFLQKNFIFYVSEEDSNIVNSFIVDGKSIDADSKSPQYSYNILVGHIGAFDKDSGLNAELRYYTLRNEQLEDKFKSYFELNIENLDNHLLNDQDNIYLSNSDLSELQSANIKEDSLNVEYKVTAIRHTETELNSNTSLVSKPEFKPKFYSKSSKQNRRLFKLIDNLDKYVYVNPETGSIYLINRIDREQILSIRFYLFVSDRMGEIAYDTENVALKNSVPVVIEIEDVNDSQPVCFPQSSTNFNRFNSFVHALDVYSIQIDLNALGVASLYPQYHFAPFYSKNTRLVQLYQFECIDNDKNKNSELVYEIESFYLKEAQEKLPTNRILNPAFVNEFILSRNVFSINSNSGILYLNLSKTWLDMNLNAGEENFTEFSVEDQFLKLVRNKFLVIKIKISDKGIVSLSTYYYLKFILCFRTDSHSTQQNYQHEIELEKNYCKPFATGHVNSNEESLNSPLILRSLMTETSDTDLANIEMDRDIQTNKFDYEKSDDFSRSEFPNLSLRLNTNRDMSSGFGQTSASTKETFISLKNSQDIFLNSFEKMRSNIWTISLIIFFLLII